MSLHHSHNLPAKNTLRGVLLFFGACVVLFAVFIHVQAFAAETYQMDDGYTVISENTDGMVFNIDEGKALAIVGQEDNIIQFTNCEFNISGGTLPIENLPMGMQYKKDQTRAKMLVNGGVTFTNCVFKVEDAGTTQNNYDAILNLYETHTGNVIFENCSIEANHNKGHFMGLYGNMAAHFNNSTVSNINQEGGWSFGQFGLSTMHLRESALEVKEMKQLGALTTAYYAADTLKHYDILYAEESDIDFSYNEGSAFALAHVGLKTSHTTLDMNNNKSDAVLGGIWKITQGTINANQNDGTAFAHVSMQAQDSMISVIENGKAGITFSADSNLKNTSTNIRSNGLRSSEYSAGDIWLDNATLQLNDCDSAWLGGVAGEGAVNVQSSNVIAQDLNDLGFENTPQPLFEKMKMSGRTSHYVFTNPTFDSAYARGDMVNVKGHKATHDADLFAQFPHKSAIIGVDAGTIQEMTEAQLSHHRYNWEDGTVISEPVYNSYGVKRIDCLQLDSFEDKTLASVYTPLINLEFVPNLNSSEQDAKVQDMPGNQMLLDYGSTFEAPSQEPTFADDSGTTYTFTGWFKDAECTEALTHESQLTDPVSYAYAGWEKKEADKAKE